MTALRPDISAHPPGQILPTPNQGSAATTQVLPSNSKPPSLAPSPSTTTFGISNPNFTQNAQASQPTKPASPHAPSNDEVEAIIKQATANANAARPASDVRPPGKDTRTQLFVGNLPYRVRWQDLKDLFRRAGPVLRADVALAPDGRSRGFGTVLLASAEDAGRAVDLLDGHCWQGRVLEVRLDRMGISLDANGSLQMGAGMGMNGVAMNGVGNAFHVPSPHHPSFLSASSGSGSLAGSLANSPLIAQLSGSSASASVSSLPAAALSSSALPSLSLPALSSTLGIPSANSAAAGGTGLAVPSPLALSTTPGLLSSLREREQEQRERERREREESIAIDLLSNLNINGPQSRSVVTSLSDVGVTSGLGSAYLEREREREFQMQMARERPPSGVDYGLGFGGVLGGGLGMGAGGVGSKSLFVGNLPFHCQWQDLKDLFRQAGAVLRADVALGPDGRSRGFGTVSFASEADAERAVRMFNGFEFNGRILKVHYDKFSSQTPLPPSALTPMQSNSAATLLHAAQLQQLFHQQNGLSAGMLGEILGSSNNFNADAYSAMRNSPPNSAISQHSSFGSRRGSMNTSGLTSGSVSFDGVSSASSFGSSAFAPSPKLASRQAQLQSQLQAQEQTYASNTPSNASSSLLGPTSSASPASTSPTSPLRRTNVTSSSTVPGASPLSRSHTQVQSQTNTSPVASSTSPRSSHPAHPGPISLPPPPPVGAFPHPLGHPLSPGHMPMSPLMYAAYVPGPISPLYPPMYTPPIHNMHGGGGVAMTPHGLAPITPSMPSFSFVPQPSPAGVAVGGSSAIPPTPAEGPFSAGGASALDNNANPGMNSHSRAASANASMHMHLSAPMASPPMHLPAHMLSPFTPGSTMSPGAFWGRPGAQSSASHLNPAVGAPVLYGQHYVHGPGSQPTSPAASGGFFPMMYPGTEPSGYFPPVPPRNEGYFPPMNSAGGSALAKEILRDGSGGISDGGASRRERRRSNSGSRSGSGHSENGNDTENEAEHEGASSVGTSWHESDDHVPTKASLATSSSSSSDPLKSLAGDMASVRLGEPPKGKRGTKKASSPIEDRAKEMSALRSADASNELEGQHSGQQSRSHSLGAAGAPRPTDMLQKTHSDETGTQVRGGTKSAGAATTTSTSS